MTERDFTHDDDFEFEDEELDEDYETDELDAEVPEPDPLEQSF